MIVARWIFDFIIVRCIADSLRSHGRVRARDRRAPRHRAPRAITLSIRRVSPTRAASASSTSPSSTSTRRELVRGARPRRTRARPRARSRPVARTTVDERRRVALARDDGVGARLRAHATSTSAARRCSAREVRVAARQREPVGLAHDRAARRPRPAGSGRRPAAAITASCCASLRPKNAVHGPVIAKSLVTTVATPSKCVGRAAPHRSAVSPSTCTVVSGRPLGYISATDGANTTSTPSRRALREIAGEVARVAVEVFARAELQRVHEDRDDDEVGTRSRAARMSDGGPRAGTPSWARARPRRPCGRARDRTRRAGRRSSRCAASFGLARFRPHRVRTGGSDALDA